MTNRENPKIAEAFEAALAWWRDAGVDCAFRDEPARWIEIAQTPVDKDDSQTLQAQSRENNPEKAPQVSTSLSESELDPVVWPRDLESFRAWWLAEPALDEGRTSGRVPPRGVRGATLMIVVPEPEAEDRDRLLSGPQGTLLAAVLSAMSVTEEQIYLASVLPRHTPAVDWNDLATRGMGDLLSHHIALVGPQRLLILGSNILPLISNAPPQGSAVLQSFQHAGMNIPLLAARSLPALRERPRWKADLWRSWLEWTE